MKLGHIIAKFFKNRVYSKNTIIILMGNVNTLITSYGSKGFSHSTHIHNNDPEYIGRYRSFMNQYRGWQVVLILDNENIKITHEALPNFQSLLSWKNSIEQFVSSHVPSESIVAYNKYFPEEDKDVISKMQHIQMTSFTPPQQLGDVVSFIYNAHFPLSGVYILRIEMQQLIKKLCDDIALLTEEKIIIVAVPTYVSGLLVMVLDNDKILYSTTTMYPQNKSNEYIKGVIEQEVYEVLLKQKKYIAHNKKKPEIIAITSPEISVLLRDNNWGIKHHSITWTNSPQKAIFPSFGDEYLIHNVQLEYPAYNLPIKKVRILEKIRDLGLKYTAGIIALLLSYVCITGYQTVKLNSTLNILENEYYNISEQYRAARKNIKDIDNLPVIYDIMSDLAILKSSQPQPIKISKYLLSSKSDKIHFSRMLWKLTNDNRDSVESELAVDMKYTGAFVSKVDLENQLTEYKTTLLRLLPDYKITFSEDEEFIIKLKDKLSVPVKFIIKGPFE